MTSASFPRASGSNATKGFSIFLQFLQISQTLRAYYPFGRSWAIEGPFLPSSAHFRPTLRLGPIHVVLRSVEEIEMKMAHFTI